MAEGIVSSVPWCCVPWCCGFKDGCQVGWHLANYWIYDDGTYTIDKCSDGDHDTIDKLPTADEEAKAWREYMEYVARTGLDPISEFRLPTQDKRKRRWQAGISNWIGSREYGLRVLGVRRRGRGPWANWDDVPTEVFDFLFLCSDKYQPGSRDLRGCRSSLGPEFKTFDELKAGATNCTVRLRKVLGHCQCALEFEVEESPAAWSDDRVKAWLIRRAKQELRE